MQKNAIVKSANKLSAKLQLPSETLPHTMHVSIDTITKSPRIESVVPKGVDILNAYVMADAGTSAPIKDLKRLCNSYSGVAADWAKNQEPYTIHWYANNGFVPNDEIKLKGVEKSK